MCLDQQKHVAPRATAEEISRAVGVTETDRRIVWKVLLEMGYLSEPVLPSARPRTVRHSSKAGSR
jgi:hypothetical protein